MTSQRFAATIKRAGFMAGVATVLAAALLAANASAAAQPRPESHDEAAVETLSPAQRDQLMPAQRDQLMPAQRGGGVSLEQAISMARSRFQGRVVRAEPVQMGDRRVYEIRILGEDGRVHIVRIDAETGAFL